ncbi:MFS transporter [uncultured Jatrophihabitans sp.]|uniref:MFS transporter n=1 Tax=uncultured Jatrophihabitans sp. TaxID=1610747 RepID=UPI0035CA099B
MPELTRRRRFLILGICCMSLLIVGMDNTIVNIALSSIHTDLHASLTDLQWTIDAYTVVLASLLMLAGSTADRLGRRRVFQIGLAVFVLGSLLCSLAPTLGWLIAFRAVQAVGGAMLNPVAMSIITNVFTDPKERAQAIGVWGGVVGLSIGVGPVVGGALIDAVDWRAIFWINIPIGLAALVLTALFVPESRAPRARRPDPVGQLLVIAVLAGLTFAIIESPRTGWTSPETLTAAVVAAAALVALLRYEPRRTDPLLDLRFFRSVPFSGATVIAVCSFGAYAGFLFLNTLYLQEVRGLRPLVAGLCTLPIAVMTLVLAPVSGRIVGSRGPRVPLLLAGVLLCAGALTLVPLSADESYLRLIASYVVFSAGFGLVNAPITNTAVSGMPREQAGTAAAVASTSRQVGSALGVAIIGSVLAAGLSGSLSTGFVAAARPAWWLIAAMGLAVLVLGAATTGRRANASAGRTAELVDPGLEPVAAD